MHDTNVLHQNCVDVLLNIFHGLESVCWTNRPSLQAVLLKVQLCDKVEGVRAGPSTIADSIVPVTLAKSTSDS